MLPTETERGRPEDSSGRLLKDDTRFALARIAVFQYVAVAVFLFLAGGFWVLQVRDHDVNSELAERNQIRTVPQPAARGKILDRDGRIIVDNQPSFSLTLSQENLKKEHLDAIAAGLHLDPEELRRSVALQAARSRYAPIHVKDELSQADLAFIESHRDPETFPEMLPVQTPRRLYPQNGLAAHVIGYVGEVSDQDLNSTEFAKYSQGERVGKSGLERQYNDILMGVDGERREQVDSAGRVRKKVDDKEATPGRNLQTTLDLDLQAVAELAMDPDRKGAVVALDPRNGEVLAMVSRPTFDPSIFSGHMRQDVWNEILNDPDKRLLNRAIQAQLAPGSTFKPIVALAALERGTIEPGTTFFCPGSATFYGTMFKCDAKHGTINLHEAITHSCDVYFYNVGDRLGVDTIAQYADAVGLGKKTGIDLPDEKEGIVPSTKWKLRTQREKWYLGETISVAIGQGATEVTPIQLATAIGGLANGGEWYRPHLVKAETAAEQPRHGDLRPENIATVVSGMYGVVNEGGTGTGAHINGIDVCGKTGSAQILSNKAAKANKALALANLDTSWFVGFSPCEHPEIVVVALWQQGEHGALAAPIVRDVIKAYFDKKVRLAQPKVPQIAWFVRPGVAYKTAP